MRLREKLFKSIMAQEMIFFDKVKTGELVNRLSSDTEMIGSSISQNLSDGLRSVVQLTAGVGMMFVEILFYSDYFNFLKLIIIIKGFMFRQILGLLV